MDTDQIAAQLELLTGMVGRLTPAAPTITVRELLSKYLDSVDFQRLRARKTDGGRIRLHLMRLLGDQPAWTVRERLGWYREQRKTEKLHGRRNPTKPATRNREVKRLMAAFAWAVREGVLPSNPLRGVAMEAEENIRRTLPVPGDIERLVVAAKTRRLRAMVALKFGSGLRRGEVCALRLDQVSLERGLIELGAMDTKTRRPRVTVLPEVAVRLLREYLADREAESPYVFCTRSGKPVSARNFLREYQNTCRRAGVNAADGEKCWLHDLRAGFACRQLELHTAQRTVMDMGGWKSESVMSRYVRVQASWITEAKRRVDADDAERISLTAQTARAYR